MAIKIGDRVRFLNATGGGVVSKIVSKELIEVTDKDGFDIPTLIRECVVVESASGEPKNETRKEKKKEDIVEDFFSKEEEYKPEETPEGDCINVSLAFIPLNIKAISTTSYECYLVNDSNYYFMYNMASGNGTLSMSRGMGVIQPNTKIFVEEIKKEQLNDLEQLSVQLLAFKQGKAYPVRPAYDIRFNINPVKFYKLHSFTENDYFDESALLLQVVKNNYPGDKQITIPEDFTQIIEQKEKRTPVKIAKKEKKPEIIEVDLHIHQLLDNVNGLTNADMLKYQTDTFQKTLQENAKNKGQKIVFIHGKGDGVLRSEILRLLKTKYPNYYHQDASFREYGFGATMVTIK